jgi:glycosyltransferase involved in cell wall biosynthesis
MRICINLIPVVSGGGQTQALNLLNHISEGKYTKDVKWFVLVSAGSTLHKWLIANGSIEFRDYKYSYVRYFFIDRRKYIKSINKFDADIIYHFTAAWPGMMVPQVVRSVFSNLYFPEILFWQTRPVFSYFKKKIIDFFRLKYTLLADGLIFENSSMQKRASDLFKYPSNRTRYIKPSIPDFLSNNACESSHFHSRFPSSTCSFKVLYLSSWYWNKNIQILPFVAYELKRCNKFVEFILTLDADHIEVSNYIVNKSLDLGVMGYFKLVGSIDPEHIESVISESDCMILLSNLECFSSNITEALAYRRPLIISDKSWSRSECGDAAVYVDRDDPEAISGAIINLMDNRAHYDAVVSLGVAKLSEFNTNDEKCYQQIEFLQDIYKIGKRF